jgi:molybdenum cofactor cytidylyltransferase
MKINQNYAAIILAAGDSQRMGFPKALLTWNDKNYCFLEKIIDEYRAAGIKNIFVIVQESLSDTLKSNYPAIGDKCSFIINYNPNLGRLYSISLGLNEISGNQHVFIQNIDNPFIDEQFIRKMIVINPGYGYVKPVFKNLGGHPVLLSNKIIPEIKKNIRKYSDLKSLLNNYITIILLHSNPYLLENINTTDDYKRLFKTN